MTDIIRKGLLKLICYDEPCEFCVLAHYNCIAVPGDVLAGIVGRNRSILLRKYWSIPDRVKEQEHIQAAFVYLSRVEMK